MTVKHLIASLFLFGAGSALASPIAGTWQGPCETRTGHSVKFTYVISGLNAEGVGRIDKTKIYYKDLNCEVYNRTGRAPVSYVLGTPSAEGVYPLDIGAGSRTYYDIV